MQAFARYFCALSLAATPAVATLVSLGETLQLTASASDANRNAITGKTFAWLSSDESIATVTDSGLVTALANDAASDRVILFGGLSAPIVFGDTWAYDFNTDTWTHMH